MPLLNGSIDTAEALGEAENGLVVPPPASIEAQSEPIYDRTQLVRLMAGYLCELGYTHTAQTLQAESHITLEDASVVRFRAAVLAGDWPAALALLPCLHVSQQDFPAVLFAIGRQRYLELLQAHRINEALKVLQNDVTPWTPDIDEAHRLAKLLITSGDRSAGDPSKQTRLRRSLLETIESHCSPEVMFPMRRLETLLGQAVQWQTTRCTYHVVLPAQPPLLCDHHCDRNTFNFRLLHESRAHTNEVWFVEFSRDGRYLAAASRDFSVSILNTSDWSLHQRLKPHSNMVLQIAMSPDARLLLSCCEDRHLRLWRIADGACMQVFDTSLGYGCVAWLPNGRSFLVGSMEHSLSWVDVDGSVLHRWSDLRRVSAVCVDTTGSHAVAVFMGKSMAIVSLASKELLRTFHTSHEITSLSMARDGVGALVSTRDQVIQLWNVHTGTLQHAYTGHCQTRFIVRSCFGGECDSIVLSGSEDSNVFVWHRESGMLLETIGGHSKEVTSVAWNPVRKDMFASASDDGSVRVWTSQSLQ